MRFAAIVLALVLGAATAADADTDRSGFPEIGRTYFHRANCHGAYDLAIEDAHAGRLSDEEGKWAESYEAAAKAKQPCPAPDAALASRATDRVLSSEESLGFAALYGDAGDPVAYFEVANAVFQAKTTKLTPAQAWQLLVESANRGYAHAQYFEALLYINGTATGKADYATALPLLESAAKAGHVDALFMAGNYYYDGSLGVKKDSAKAFTYFSHAAERGHVYATYMAANMANDGAGVKTDHQLAYRLARNLAGQGEVVGSVIAASALLQMKDAKDREDEVLYWLDTAIRNGDGKLRDQVNEMRPKVVAAFQRANAPPEYQPRVWKACPMKTTCLVDTISGRRECTTNKDYWNDCDG
jgi:TPR repeat protein